MIDARSLLPVDCANFSPKERNPIISGSLTDVEGIKKKQGRPAKIETKRPVGMKREVFNLLGPGEEKDITSMMPAQSKTYRNPKAQIGNRPVRKYKWTEFENEARSDGLRLFHWQRVDRIESQESYPFAAMNKVINIPSYNDDEYSNHLESHKWTREETDILFELCRQFDRRWLVVADRYEMERKHKQLDKRSMEDLKERFYSVVSELNVIRQTGVESFCYDAEHEKRRKEQLKRRWERSSTEIKEEEELQNELKRIEARRKDRERKAQDLQKLINMEQHSPSASGSLSPAPSKKKLLRNKIGSSSSTALSSAIPGEIASSSLRFCEFRSAGVHLRSQEMKLPTNISQKKLKNIETVIDKLKLDMNPMGAEEIVMAYNDFRSSVLLLQELKLSLQTAEFDLESLRSRLIQQGLPPFEVEPRMRIAHLPEGGYDTSLVGMEGAPSSTRLIASYIDSSHTANPLSTRKKKMTSSPTSLLKSRKS